VGGQDCAELQQLYRAVWAASPNTMAQDFCEPGGPWWDGDSFQFPLTLPSQACCRACGRWEQPPLLEQSEVFHTAAQSQKRVPQG